MKNQRIQKHNKIKSALQASKPVFDVVIMEMVVKTTYGTLDIIEKDGQIAHFRKCDGTFDPDKRPLESDSIFVFPSDIDLTPKDTVEVTPKKVLLNMQFIF